MSWRHWLKRFALALTLGGAVLFAVQRLKGHAALNAAEFAACWGTISASIFTLTGYVRYRRSPACMLPRSGPE